MGLYTATNLPKDGETIDAADVNTDLQGMIDEFNGSIDNDNLNVSSVFTTILAQIYPVGSIYTNASVATNPATLLGFGTWTAFGAGKVAVGFDSTDTNFDAAEETGGAKTHTHTGPSHTHTGPSHTHNVYTAGMEARFSAAGGAEKEGSGGSGHYGVDAINITSGAGGTGATGADGTGATAATSTLQPYITVYMWKRTA